MPCIIAAQPERLPNRQKKPPAGGREKAAIASGERRLTSCGAESWPACDVSCGPAYAALFQTSSFPQGLQIGWLLYVVSPYRRVNLAF
jgi:hypothetical protein